jgi:hypothetical protein
MGNRRASSILGFALLGIGSLCLVFSVAFTSIILVFIGLVLTFSGGSLLFIELGISLAQLEHLRPPNPSQQSPKTRRRPSTLISYTLAIIGILSLGLAVAESSTILAFIGLGLTFWGAILLFIRPQGYVRSDLMDSTALSSLKTIDRVMVDQGFTEKGVYLPAHNPEKAVVFVPSEPFGRIPRAEELEGQTFVKNPRGIAMVPPGLALANLFEKELGVNLAECSLESLRERLPKVLIEDLEMVEDFDMQINGDVVRFKLVGSVYSDFCSQLRGLTKVSCSLGCPICSAMACVLTMATGRPVSFEADKFSPDARTIETSYRILEQEA